MLKDRAIKSTAFVVLLGLGLALGYLLALSAPKAINSLTPSDGTVVVASSESAPAPQSEPASPPNSTSEEVPAEPAVPSQAAEDALVEAAQNGNSRAQYALALAYENGRGVDVDNGKANALMRKAADQNLTVAQRTLGEWYEQGEIVSKDLVAARRWYEKASKNGDVQAMHNLGFFYAQGMGGLSRDGSDAIYWFKEAAERGLVASQVNLGIIYVQSASYGMPVRSDLGYYWSAIAARTGDEEATGMRNAIGRTLPAGLKQQLDDAVGKWRAKPVDLIANGGFDSSPEAFLPPDQQAPLTAEEVTSIQKKLSGLGFDPGQADGTVNDRTIKAIRAFQAAFGLPQDGRANLDLLAALAAVPH